MLSAQLKLLLGKEANGLCLFSQSGILKSEKQYGFLKRQNYHRSKVTLGEEELKNKNKITRLVVVYVLLSMVMKEAILLKS